MTAIEGAEKTGTEQKRTDSQKLANIDALEQERREEVVDLLTPAQQQRYDQITERMELWLAERTR